MLKCTLRRFLAGVLVSFTLWTLPVQASEVYNVPDNSSFKSYMDYGAITNTRSKQYKIQQQCETDENGLRTYNGYYTIAVGTGFGVGVGDYVDVKLSTGTLLHCVIGDMKQNKHTGPGNIQVSSNGNVIEFIVDMDHLDSSARAAGDISEIPGFEGDVETVTVLGGTVKFSDLEKSSSTAEVSRQTIIELDYEYLIVGKNEIPMLNGETIYTIEYAFSNSFNNLLCSKEFYDSVDVGDVINSLE